VIQPSPLSKRLRVLVLFGSSCGDFRTTGKRQIVVDTWLRESSRVALGDSFKIYLDWLWTPFSGVFRACGHGPRHGSGALIGGDCSDDSGGLDELAGPVIGSDPDLRFLRVNTDVNTRPPNRACSGALSVGVDLLSGAGFAHRLLRCSYFASAVAGVRSRCQFPVLVRSKNSLAASANESCNSRRISCHKNVIWDVAGDDAAHSDHAECSECHAGSYCAVGTDCGAATNRSGWHLSVGCA